MEHGSTLAQGHHTFSGYIFGLRPVGLGRQFRVADEGNDLSGMGLGAWWLRAWACVADFLFSIREQYRFKRDIILFRRTKNGHFQPRPGRLSRRLKMG